MGEDESTELTDRVYQAAEDSALLAEAARGEVSSEHCVLDIGTGSGYVAARMAETGAHVIGSDCNPHACRQAYRNGIEVVRTDLTSAFRSGTFDVVLFNPPYLPTEPEEAGNGEAGDGDEDDWMETALSGGETGRAVVEPFLDSVSRVLAPDGFVLLLVSTLTGLDEVETRAREVGLEPEQIADESHFFERLVVLKLVSTD